MRKKHAKAVYPRKISRILRVVGLSAYCGVAEHYLAFAEKSILSEGKQAVDRLKSYKLFVEKRIAERRFTVPKGKYRHLKPIIRLLQSLFDKGEESKVWAVMSILRCYELYKPTNKVVIEAREAFDREVMTDKKPTRPFVPETFPLVEFLDYLDAIKPILVRHLKEANHGHMFGEPVESAIFLAKNGSSQIDSRKNDSWGDRPPFLDVDKEEWDKREFGYTLPAILSSVADAVYLTLHDTALARKYQRLADIEGHEFNLHGTDLFRWVDKVIPNYDDQFYLSNIVRTRLRRNVSLFDKGFKVRHIFIGDYWCNYMLYPLHDAQMNLLKSLPCDFTRNHNCGFDVLNRQTGTKDWIGCYDLHSATDFFPVGIQYWVLRTIYGREYADLWYEVVVQQPTEDGLYYAYGQGMGLPSSWVVFALSHHLIVSFADSRVQRKVITPWDYDPEDPPYLLIGDDIAISDYSIAAEYSALMSSLRVQINMSKSHIVDHKARVSEFVKRISFNGTEITGISPSLLTGADEDVRKLQTLARLLEDRYGIDPLVVSATYKKYYPGWVQKWITMNESIPLFMGGFLSSGMHLDPEAIMEPEGLKVALITSLKSVTKYAYRGDLIDRKGHILMDKVTAFADGLPPYMSAQLVDYERHHGEEHRLLCTKLEGTVFSRLLDILEMDDSLEILCEAESLYSWLNSPEVGNIQFYQRSEVHDLEMRDYVHKLWRNLKLVKERGLPLERLARRRFLREEQLKEDASQLAEDHYSSSVGDTDSLPAHETESPRRYYPPLEFCDDEDPLSETDFTSTPSNMHGYRGSLDELHLP